MKATSLFLFICCFFLTISAGARTVDLGKTQRSLELLSQIGEQLGVEGIAVSCEELPDQSICDAQNQLTQLLTKTSHIVEVLNPIVQGGESSALNTILAPERERQYIAVLYQFVRAELPMVQQALAGNLAGLDQNADKEIDKKAKWLEKERQHLIEALVLLGNSWRRVQDEKDEHEKHAKRLSQKLDGLLQSGQGQILRQYVLAYSPALRQRINQLYADQGSKVYLNRMEALTDFGNQLDKDVSQAYMALLNADGVVLKGLESKLSRWKEKQWRALAPDISKGQRKLTSIQDEVKQTWMNYFCQEISVDQLQNQCFSNMIDDADVKLQSLLKEVHGELHSRLYTLFRVTEELDLNTCAAFDPAKLSESAIKAYKKVTKIDLSKGQRSDRNNIDSRGRRLVKWFQRCEGEFASELAEFETQVEANKVSKEELRLAALHKIKQSVKNEKAALAQAKNEADQHFKNVNNALTAAFDELNAIHVGASRLLGQANIGLSRQVLQQRALSTLSAHINTICDEQEGNLYATPVCKALTEELALGENMNVKRIKQSIQTGFQETLLDCMLMAPTQIKTHAQQQGSLHGLWQTPSVYARPVSLVREGKRIRAELDVTIIAGNFSLPTPREFCQGVSTKVGEDNSEKILPNFFNTELSYKIDTQLPEAFLSLENTVEFYQQRLKTQKAELKEITDDALQKVLTRLRVPHRIPIDDNRQLTYSFDEGLVLRWPQASLCARIIPGDADTLGNCPTTVDFNDPDAIDTLLQHYLDSEIAGVKDQFEKQIKEKLEKFSTALAKDFELEKMLKYVQRYDDKLVFHGRVHELFSTGSAEKHAPLLKLVGNSGLIACVSTEDNSQHEANIYIDPQRVVDKINGMGFVKLFPNNGDLKTDSTCGIEHPSLNTEYQVYASLQEQIPQALGIFSFSDCSYYSDDVKTISLWPGLSIAIEDVFWGEGQSCLSIVEELRVEGKLSFDHTANSDSLLQGLDKPVNVKLLISDGNVEFLASPDLADLKKVAAQNIREFGLLPAGFCLKDLRIHAGKLTPVIGKQRNNGCQEAVNLKKEIKQLQESLADIGRAQAAQLLADKDFQKQWRALSAIPDTAAKLAKTIEADLRFVKNGLEQHIAHHKIGEYFDVRCKTKQDMFRQCTIQRGNALADLLPDICAQRYILRIKPSNSSSNNEVFEVYDQCLQGIAKKVLPPDLIDKVQTELSRDHYKVTSIDEGVSIQIAVPIVDDTLKDVVGEGKVSLGLNVYWDGRVAPHTNVAEDMKRWTTALARKHIAQQLDNLQDFVNDITNNFITTLDSTWFRVHEAREAWKYVLPNGSTIPFNRSSELSVMPVGIETDVDVLLSEGKRVTLKGVRFSKDDGLDLSQVLFSEEILQSLEKAFQQVFDLGPAFEKIDVKHLTSTKDDIFLRIRYEGLGELVSEQYAFTLDALDLYIDVRIGKNSMKVSGQGDFSREILVTALAQAINSSGLLPFELADDQGEGVKLGFDRVKAEGGDLRLLGELAINDSFNIAMPAEIRIPVLSQASPSIKVMAGGIEALLKKTLLANIPMPDLGPYKLDGFCFKVDDDTCLDLDSLKGLPKQINIQSSMRLWEVINVSLPTYSIGPKGVKVEGMDVLKLTTGDAVQVPIPPAFAMTEIGGSISREEMQALATIAPLEASLKHLIRMDGRHVLRFDNPLRLESHSDLKLLNFLSLGKSHKIIDLESGTIQQGMDLGGIAKDIIDFNGKALTEVKQTRFNATGHLNLFGEAVGANAKLGGNLLSGKTHAEGDLAIGGDFITGELDFTSKRFLSGARGKAKVDINIDDFKLSSGQLKVDPRIAHLKFKVLGLSLGIGFPNLTEIDEEAILDLIKNMLSPDLSNLDEALLSLLKGNFAFNPASSFGGGDGSGFDGDSDSDSSDSENSGDGDSGESTDQAGGYSELAGHAAATESQAAQNVPAGSPAPDPSTSTSPNAEGRITTVNGPPGNVNLSIESKDSDHGRLYAWYSGDTKDHFMELPRTVQGAAVFKDYSGQWSSLGAIAYLNLPEFELPKKRADELDVSNTLVTVLPHGGNTQCQDKREAVFYWFAGSSQNTALTTRVPAAQIQRPGSPETACWDGWQGLMGLNKEVKDDPVLSAFFEFTAAKLDEWQLDAENQNKTVPIADAFWLPEKKAGGKLAKLPIDGSIALAVRYEGEAHHSVFVLNQSYKLPLGKSIFDFDIPRRSGQFAVAFADRIRGWDQDKQTAFLEHLLRAKSASTEVYEVEGLPEELDSTLILDDKGIVEWQGQEFTLTSENCSGNCYYARQPGHQQRKQSLQMPDVAAKKELVEEDDLSLLSTSDVSPPPGQSSIFGGSAGRRYSDILEKSPGGFTLYRQLGNNSKKELITLPPSAQGELKAASGKGYESKGLYLTANKQIYAHIPNNKWDGKLVLYYKTLHSVERLELALPADAALSKRLKRPWLAAFLAEFNDIVEQRPEWIKAFHQSEADKFSMAIHYRVGGQLNTLLYAMSPDHGVTQYALLPLNIYNTNTFDPKPYLSTILKGLMQLDVLPEGRELRMSSAKAGSKIFLLSSNGVYTFSSNNAKYLAPLYSVEDNGPLLFSRSAGKARRANERLRIKAIEFGLNKIDSNQGIEQFIVSGPYGGENYTGLAYKPADKAHFQVFIGKQDQGNTLKPQSADTAKLDQLMEDLIYWTANTGDASLKNYYLQWVVQGNDDGENIAYDWIRLCDGKKVPNFTYPQAGSYEAFLNWFKAEFRGLAGKNVENLGQWVTNLAQNQCPQSIDYQYALNALTQAVGKDFDVAKTNRFIEMSPTPLRIRDLASLQTSPKAYSEALITTESWNTPTHIVAGKDAFVVSDSKTCKGNKACLAYHYAHHRMADIPSLNIPEQLEPLFLQDLGAYFSGRSLKEIQGLNYQPTAQKIASGMSVYRLSFENEETTRLYYLVDNMPNVLSMTDTQAFNNMTSQLQAALLNFVSQQQLRSAQLHQAADYYFLQVDDLIFPFKDGALPNKAISGFYVAPALVQQALTLISEHVDVWLTEADTSLKGRLVSLESENLNALAINHEKTMWDVVLQSQGSEKTVRSLNICQFSSHLFDDLNSITDVVDGAAGHYISSLDDSDCASKADAVLVSGDAQKRLYFLDGNPEQMQQALPAELNNEALILAFAQEMLNWRRSGEAMPESLRVTALTSPNEGVMVSFDEASTWPQKFSYLFIEEGEILARSLRVYKLDEQVGIEKILPSLACLYSTDEENYCSDKALNHEDVASLYVMPSGELFLHSDENLLGFDKPTNSWPLVAEHIPNVGLLTPAIAQALAESGNGPGTSVDIIHQALFDDGHSTQSVVFSIGDFPTQEKLDLGAKEQLWIASLDTTTQQAAGLLTLESLKGSYLPDFALAQLQTLAGHAVNYRPTQKRIVLSEGGKIYQLGEDEVGYSIAPFEGETLGLIGTKNENFVKAVARDIQGNSGFNSEFYKSTALGDVLAVQFKTQGQALNKEIQAYYAKHDNVFGLSFSAIDLSAANTNFLTLNDPRVSRTLGAYLKDTKTESAESFRIYYIDNTRSFQWRKGSVWMMPGNKEIGDLFPSSVNDEVYENMLRSLSRVNDIPLFSRSFGHDFSSGQALFAESERRQINSRMSTSTWYAQIHHRKHREFVQIEAHSQVGTSPYGDLEKRFFQRMLDCRGIEAFKSEFELLRVKNHVYAKANGKVLSGYDAQCKEEWVGELGENALDDNTLLLQLLDSISQAKGAKERFVIQRGGKFDSTDYLLVKWLTEKTRCKERYGLQLMDESREVYHEFDNCGEKISFTSDWIERLDSSKCFENSDVALFKKGKNEYCVAQDKLWTLDENAVIPLVENLSQDLVQIRAVINLLPDLVPLDQNTSHKPVFHGDTSSDWNSVAFKQMKGDKPFYQFYVYRKEAVNEGKQFSVYGDLWADAELADSLGYWAATLKGNANIHLIDSKSDDGDIAGNYFFTRNSDDNTAWVHGALANKNWRALVDTGRYDVLNNIELLQAFLQDLESRWLANESLPNQRLEWLIDDTSPSLAYSALNNEKQAKEDKNKNNEVTVIITQPDHTFTYHPGIVEQEPASWTYLRDLAVNIGAVPETTHIRFHALAERQFVELGSEGLVAEEGNEEGTIALYSDHSCQQEALGKLPQALADAALKAEVYRYLASQDCPNVTAAKVLDGNNENLAFILQSTPEKLNIFYRKKNTFVGAHSLPASFINNEFSVVMAALELQTKATGVQFNESKNNYLARVGDTLHFLRDKAKSKAYDVTWTPALYSGNNELEKRIESVWHQDNTVLTKYLLNSAKRKSRLGDKPLVVQSLSQYHSVIEYSKKDKETLLFSSIKDDFEIDIEFPWNEIKTKMLITSRFVLQSDPAHPCAGANPRGLSDAALRACFNAAFVDLEESLVEPIDGILNVFFLMTYDASDIDKRWYIHTNDSLGEKTVYNEFLGFIFHAQCTKTEEKFLNLTKCEL